MADASRGGSTIALRVLIAVFALIASDVRAQIDPRSLLKLDGGGTQEEEPPLGRELMDGPNILGRFAPPQALVPPREGRDQISVKLDTGEWLVGRLEKVNYGRIYLNSEKMDRVNFDFDDVVEFHSNSEFEYDFRDDTKIRGIGTVWGDRGRLILRTGEVMEFERHQLLSIFTGDVGFLKARWFGDVTLSFETLSGNTEEESFDFSAEINRRVGSFESVLGGRSTYQTSDREETRKRHELYFQADYDLSREFYLTLFRTDYVYDRFQNIDYRVRAGIGAGWNILRDEIVNLRLETGPAYEVTKFRRVQPSQSDDDDLTALRFGLRADWEINEDIDFEIRGDSYVPFSGADDATHNYVAELSIDILEQYGLDMELDFELQYLRDESPERRSDGTLPDRDDVRFLIGLGWEF